MSSPPSVLCRKPRSNKSLIFRHMRAFAIVRIFLKPARATAPARVRKWKADERPRDDVSMFQAHRHLANKFALADENHGATTDQIKLRAFAQASDLPGKTLREANIVGIHPGDEFSFAESHRLVEACRQSGGTGFADQPNPPVTKPLDDGAALIGGAVIDNDHFPIAQRLHPNRAYGHTNGRGAVSHRHDDRLPQDRFWRQRSSKTVPCVNSD